MNWFVFRCALQDYLRPGRVMVWGTMVLIVAVAGFAWRVLGVGLTAEQSYGQMMDVLVFKLIALASAVFSTMVIGQEVEQRTLVYLLTRPIPRAKLLVSRWMASVSAVTGLGVLLVLAAAMATIGPGGLTQPLVLRDLLLTLVAALAYGAFFLLLGMLLAKPLIWCLLFVFGWETFVPNMPGDLVYVSIFTYVNALALRVELDQEVGLMTALSGEIAQQVIPVATSVVVLAGIVVGFVALSLLKFQRFEYTPREDPD